MTKMLLFLLIIIIIIIIDHPSGLPTHNSAFVDDKMFLPSLLLADHRHHVLVI
jgi:hypothetical protein